MSDLTYKPSAFYFRRRLRQTDEPAELREVGLAVVTEMERLRSWVRDQGLIPPKWTVDPAEAKDKRWKVKRGAKAVQQ
jgi:predicted GNAT superfamily acetyltransferase